MKGLTLVVFIGTVSALWGQDVTTVLEQVRANYTSTQRMEYTATYELFKAGSEQKQSSYKGYVYKEGNRLYQKIDQTELVYTPDFSLKVNHKQQSMEVGRGEKMVYSGFDLDQVLGVCQSKSMTKQGKDYRVELVLNAGGISKIRLKVDARYLLQQVDVYYAVLQDFSTERGKTDMAVPHLKITMQDHSKNPAEQLERFTRSRYLVTREGNDIPAADFKGYAVTKLNN